MSNEKPIRVRYRLEYIRKHHKFTGCLIGSSGDTAWYKNGKCHRENGPAIEYADGNKWWYLNGKKHRTDGPAVEYSDGSKEWRINGQQLAEQEHRMIVRQMKIKLLDI